MNQSLDRMESVFHEETMMWCHHELHVKLFDQTIIICERNCWLSSMSNFKNEVDVIMMKRVIKIRCRDPYWSVIYRRNRFPRSTSCHIDSLSHDNYIEKMMINFVLWSGVQTNKEMDPSFQRSVHEILSSVIKKKTNREKIGECIWKESQNDHYPEQYARYLLYEVMVEMTIHAKVEDCIRYVKKKKMGWIHVDFNKFHVKQKEYDNFLLEPPEVEEGVIECHRCKSKKTFSFSKQTRSSDESATVFVRCAQCNHSFRM